MKKRNGKTTTTRRAPAVRYSDGERRALDALKRSPERRLTTLELIRAVYAGDAPFHARQAVAGTMKSLSAKVERNRERFSVRKSRRAGSKPATFTLEERAAP
jgi:hypothetical protein